MEDTPSLSLLEENRATEPDWATLPADIFFFILRHLNGAEDKSAAAAICSEWRAAAKLNFASLEYSRPVSNYNLTSTCHAWPLIADVQLVGSNNLTALSGLQHLTSLKVLGQEKDTFVGGHCLHQSRLAKLELRGMELSAGAFDCIDHQTGLTELSLYYCCADSLERLSSLRSLRALSLVRDSSQPITSGRLEFLRGKQLLRILDLSGQEISDAHANVLGTLSSLETLNVSGGNLSDVGLGTLLAHLPRLRGVNLQGNERITGSGLTALPRDACISRLAFFGCSDLTTLKGLQGLPELSELELAMCTGLTSTSLTPLTTLSSLTVLDLSSCQLSSAAVLGHLTGLRSLNLAFNAELCDSHVEDLLHMSGLKDLDVSCCGFSTVERLLALTSLTSLQALQSLSSLTNHDIKVSKPAQAGWKFMDDAWCYLRSRS